jgi:transcriptional regulator GlxA family with amidase domain
VQRLLDETILPMTEIASQAGFRSLRRFNAVFCGGLQAPSQRDQSLKAAGFPV